MEDVLYLYNLYQCSFYMTHGVQAIDCGKHPITKKVWHKFRKEDTKEVYLLWLQKCKEFNESK